MPYWTSTCRLCRLQLAVMKKFLGDAILGAPSERAMQSCNQPSPAHYQACQAHHPHGHIANAAPHPHMASAAPYPHMASAAPYPHPHMACTTLCAPSPDSHPPAPGYTVSTFYYA
ncbi:hypothetical protein HaLaN_19659 [Haematococcus lacustris]|uniref:Uncharacterized protein n=1 Tax=Haematococcus lacustris TaxID=44745 RepID=A0A699ZM92_HAELA|nr:hypothetical protein HaLaN_19659 [Haematococcus lacustris]